MNGVLIVAHGSRARETELTMQAIVAMVTAKLAGHPVGVAYNEFSEQTIERGVAGLADLGVDEITVVPYFLFSGMHIKNDLTEKIAACKRAYPHISISLGETLGADERLADIVVDRVIGSGA